MREMISILTLRRTLAIDLLSALLEFYNYDGTATNGGNIPCATPAETQIFNTALEEQTICPGQMIFEETFDFLNTNRWTVQQRFSSAPASINL